MLHHDIFNRLVDYVSLADKEVTPARRLLRADHTNVLLLLSDAIAAVSQAVPTVLEGHAVSLQRVRAKSYRILWDDGQTCTETIVRSTSSAIFFAGKVFMLGAERLAERLVVALSNCAASRFATAS